MPMPNDSTPTDDWQEVIKSISSALDQRNSRLFDEACANISLMSIGIDTLPSSVFDFFLSLLDDERFLSFESTASYFITMNEAMLFTLTGNQLTKVLNALEACFLNANSESVSYYLIRELLVARYPDEIGIKTIKKLYSKRLSLEKRESLATGLLRIIERRTSNDLLDKVREFSAQLSEDDSIKIKKIAEVCIRTIRQME